MNETKPEPILTETQLRRVEALKQARSVLAVRSPVTVGAVDVFDVIRAAHYILTGEDD